ncbi:heterokaryon incompatibility protein-domain-containing protein [Colletotrichum godetiae]|uniref:Heterokaryon incompatibility protein-domain-containing protein n=1 Tax=Colletotrichum godetiae TaxID=1209918 RepID=A0AAJ0AD35_9PEZI|nr:heterokaryon incompatibility protein-domain-containing protein [Colletotrichum godetiae]KAK1671700.1 heterokaryon incompatibility protein-domain-containing protein [Colletotrichum godetiae]
MKAFQYEPLDLGLRSFRLLILYPGGSDIRCDIFQASLEPDENIPYEALSYAWGCTDLIEPISANGKRLFVTRNLFLALNHLRTEEARILWVDALCIDQSNLAERGHQVGHMAGIYRQAEQVLVWLGHSTQDTIFLMDALSKTRRGSKSLEGNASCPVSLLDPGFIAGNLDGLRKGLEHLFEQPWFTRVWVLQEVSYARVALICCGHHSIPAYIFVEATRLAGIKLHDRQQALLDLMPSPSNKRSARKKSLYTLLVQFCTMQATDPRDMVYALLGIAADTQQGTAATLISADYLKSEEQLIHDLRTYILVGETQGRLAHCPDMLIFLNSLSALTADRLVYLVAADRIENAKLLCDRHALLKPEVSPNALLRLTHGRKTSKVNLIFRKLLVSEAPKLSFNMDCLIAILASCDLPTAVFLIKMPGNGLLITKKLVRAMRERRDVRAIHSLDSGIPLVRQRFFEELTHWSIPITQEAFVAILRWLGPTRTVEIANHQCNAFKVNQMLVDMARISFPTEPVRDWFQAMLASEKIKLDFNVE